MHDPIATPSSTTFGYGNGAANLAGVKDAFVKGIKGTVNYGPSSGYLTLDGTLAGYTKMANLDGVPFFQNVSTLIEDYMRNTSISLLATSPPPPSAPSSCLTSDSFTVYQYKPAALIAGYGALFFVSLICALVGMRALLYLGGGGVNSFSLVVSTTRNRKLDAFFMSDGGEKVIFSQKPRFKYEMIEDDDGNLHYAFTQQELPSNSFILSEVSSQVAVESGALSNNQTGPTLVRPIDMNESGANAAVESEALSNTPMGPTSVRPMDMNETNDQGANGVGEVSSQVALESGALSNSPTGPTLVRIEDEALSNIPTGPTLVRTMDMNESNDQGASGIGDVTSQATVESEALSNTPTGPTLVRPMDMNESDDQRASGIGEVSSQAVVESGALSNTPTDPTLVRLMDMNESNDQGANGI